MEPYRYLFNINSFKWTYHTPRRTTSDWGGTVTIYSDYCLTNHFKTKLYLFGGQFDDTSFNDLAV